jgi:hypothetical protein
VGRVNRAGIAVLALLLTALLFTGIAITRGQFDGAATLAAVALTFAVFTTVWAATNRKRTP